MPRESLYVRARAGESADWGHTEHLLAAVIDQLGVLAWQQAAIHRGKNEPEPKRPDPIRRPGQTSSTAQRKVSLRDMAQQLRKGKRR